MGTKDKVKKLTNASRKNTLLRMLEDIGNYRGIDIERTPGEECAISIAMQLIKSTSIEELDALVEREKVKFGDVFWEKQW